MATRFISDQVAYRQCLISQVAHSKANARTWFQNVQGIDIIVPYRKRKCNGLEPFDAAHEDQALENFTTNLTSVLMKLAQPGAPKSLRQVENSHRNAAIVSCY